MELINVLRRDPFDNEVVATINLQADSAPILLMEVLKREIDRGHTVIIEKHRGE